ncbi:hypothetical protein CFOL_v3_30769 [Cephalotus follicularis]|uniref:Uncharacterized protein n=1 Tax=Cephalotus follicularis TaxID=3775 RepID=A0A1Q3D4V9_CEPFO|nr:hypothetical protein CFOL_v3_30769 [Cephalotus follicularis]
MCGGALSKYKVAYISQIGSSSNASGSSDVAPKQTKPHTNKVRCPSLRKVFIRKSKRRNLYRTKLQSLLERLLLRRHPPQLLKVPRGRKQPLHLIRAKRLRKRSIGQSFLAHSLLVPGRLSCMKSS